MDQAISIIVMLGMIGIFVYGISYFISKVGTDDEQD
jgi:uncharacterized membrane protein YadS